MTDFKQFLDSTGGTKKDNPFMYATTIPQHPTGFMYLDYGCGTYLNVYNDNEEPIYTYHNIGIGSGSVNSLLSKSQGGKTTLAIQMGCAIIEPYLNPIYYERFVRANATKKDMEAVSAFHSDCGYRKDSSYGLCKEALSLYK